MDNSILTYEHGASAIRFLEKAKNDDTEARLPALIVLDIRMPTIGGFEILEWIKAQPFLNRIPVIMLTSSASPEDAKRSAELGADSCLIKVWSMDQMIELVQRMKQSWFARE